MEISKSIKKVNKTKSLQIANKKNKKKFDQKKIN